ncbi:hypothetical protein BgiMline_035625 [Biomphalaria glabrata]|nr:putative tigger transposable element-derived protein 3 isoform X2 [Biomphalaria glabrata]KAI8764529.1 tigger transposable element-derived protein 3 isoform X2 [Biomphalaria glabrata]
MELNRDFRCDVVSPGHTNLQEHFEGDAQGLALGQTASSVGLSNSKARQKYFIASNNGLKSIECSLSLQPDDIPQTAKENVDSNVINNSSEASVIKCRYNNGLAVGSFSQNEANISTSESSNFMHQTCFETHSTNLNHLAITNDDVDNDGVCLEATTEAESCCVKIEPCLYTESSSKFTPQSSSKTTAPEQSLLALLQDRQELLKLLGNQNVDKPLTNGQCKILTKYVFNNKSPKRKSKKKKFGVLYKKAFKHIYRSKLLLKKQNSDIPKAQTDGLSNITKKNGFKALASSNINGIQSAKKNKHKNESKAFSKESNSSSEVQTNCYKRKVLSLTEKVEIIKAMDQADSSLASVLEQFGISKTLLWRILKRKEDILSKHGAGGQVNKKMRSKCIPGFDTKKNKNDFDENDGSHPEEDEWLLSEFSGIRAKGKFRNRKDLTLEEKVKVIQALEAPGTKINAMAKKFGVSVSSISRINKNKDFIMQKSSSGDSSGKSKRSRECKDPELDRALLKWYRAIEKHHPDKKISISNVLLKEKAHDLASIMGKNYFPSDNWIIRWKHRHNLMSKTNMIHDRAELQRQDTVNIADILEKDGKLLEPSVQIKREDGVRHGEKPEQFFICEHCGVLTSNKKRKENQHLPGCPASAIRKDLTLEEKVQVVRALEEPGVKMIHLAKRYGVSASAISRIAKNRVDILARKASGLSNSQRKRDRTSKEPEIEKALCEWFKFQHEMGIHISGSMIREKARDIAQVMGKDFWPSESWVFRWRQRNNVSDMNAVLYADSENEDNELSHESTVMNADVEGISDIKVSFGAEVAPEKSLGENENHSQSKKKKDGESSEKKCKVPRSVMCEKCGFVSSRVKKSRIKNLRHAKGCPDMKPRHELTYETRAQMLKALDKPGATLSSVARQFGVSVSSMSRINANKERILNHCLDHSEQKRIRFCKEPEVAQCLYQWYLDKKAEGVHVTGTKLKEMARKMAADLGRDFKASSGWLGRWRHRYNIVSSTKGSDKTIDGSLKRKKQIKKQCQVSDGANQVVHYHPVTSDVHQDSLGSSTSLMTEHSDMQLGSQQNPQPPVFLHQRFSNPWEASSQQPSSCVWGKDFISPSSSSIQNDGGIPVTYAYNDEIPKPVFHNIYEPFPGASYQVAMPIDSALLSRDFIKPDSNDDKMGQATSLTSHTSHHSIPHHSRALPANHGTASNLHHHIVTNQINIQHTSLQPSMHLSQISHPLPPPSPVLMDDDAEQQRQVMEAFRIMNSFAQKKSLGDHVQAALRTIEMTVKSQSKKNPSRQSYTSI